jgi:UDP-glucuronate 4-epimerase
MNLLVTGAAGFLGYATAAALLKRGDTVHGVDNFSPYYDVRLKEARLERLKAHPKFSFTRLDIAEREKLAQLFSSNSFDAVVHLAAQAGVRYSIDHPHAYGDANLSGFLNILEGCRHAKVKHLVYASSSSVYGANAKTPFAEDDNVDHPISLYAATKKANELMAHSYAHLYGLPCTGLRFFTVYGPWGRPDMAYFKFTKGILAGEPIPVFNRGDMSRDFTYVDDVVEGILKVVDRPAAPDPDFDPRAPAPSTSRAPYRVFNIGNSSPVDLMRFIQTLEKCLGRKAKLELLPMQPGDVPATVADVSKLQRAVGYRPSTPIEVGIARFVEWYRSYYKA